MSNKITNTKQIAIYGICDKNENTDHGMHSTISHCHPVGISGQNDFQAAPKFAQTAIYRRLAKRIAEHTELRVPSLLSSRELRT